MRSGVSRTCAALRHHSGNAQQPHHPTVLRPRCGACRWSTTSVRRCVERPPSPSAAVGGAELMGIIQTLRRAPPFARLPRTGEHAASTCAWDAGLPVTQQNNGVPAIIPRFVGTETGRRPALDRRLSLRAVSFAAVVLVPIAVVAAYLFIIAADQYVAEF